MHDTNFNKIVDEAIRLIQSGKDFSAVLEMYPEHKEELETILPSILKLSTLRIVDDRSNDEILHSILDSLDAKKEQEYVFHASVGFKEIFNQFLSSFKFIAPALAVLMIMILGASKETNDRRMLGVDSMFNINSSEIGMQSADESVMSMKMLDDTHVEPRSMRSSAPVAAGDVDMMTSNIISYVARESNTGSSYDSVLLSHGETGALRSFEQIYDENTF